MTSNAHSIPDLPLELWREILSYLTNRGIKSARLASKKFSNSVELNFPRVFLSPNPLIIEVFCAIADHEIFRHQVREIVWDDARLSRGPQQETGVPGGESDVSDDETEESKMVFPSYRFKCLTKDLDWDYEDEIHGFDDDDDEEECDDIEVDELYHISSKDKVGWPLPLYEQPTEVKALAWSSLHEKHKERYHGFRVVTRALAKERNNVVELSLDACQIRTGVNCTIFDYACDEYSNLETVLKQPGFRRLDLALTIRGNEEPGQNWQSFRNGRLHHLLSQACDMEDVRLHTAGIEYGYERKDVHKYAAPVPLSNIFPFEKWSKLRNFELSRFIVQQEDVLSCLSKLPPTLKSVSLSFLTFTDDAHNWNTFLTEMQRGIRARALWPYQKPDVMIGFEKDISQEGCDLWVGKETNAFLYEEGQHPFNSKGYIDTNLLYEKEKDIQRDALDPQSLLSDIYWQISTG